MFLSVITDVSRGDAPLAAPGGDGAGDDTLSVDSDSLAKQLSDLKSRLDYVKNMYPNGDDKVYFPSFIKRSDICFSHLLKFYYIFPL